MVSCRWCWLYSQSPARASSSRSDALAPAWEGKGWSLAMVSHGVLMQRENALSSSHSFSTPRHGELRFHSQSVIAAGCVQGASLLVKGGCGMEIPRARLCIHMHPFRSGSCVSGHPVHAAPCALPGHSLCCSDSPCWWLRVNGAE